jgi:cbb3-type cytochrome oxidase maturation protein
MVWCLGSSLLLGIAGLLTYLYYHKQGQFEDQEDVKYQLFRDEEEDG